MAVKIAVEENGLVMSGRSGGSIQFSDIAEVEAEKVGKITYDEVFLIVREESGDGISLGELDQGFAQAEKALRSQLPNFPSDWWAAAEQAPVGARAHVWSSSS